MILPSVPLSFKHFLMCNKVLVKTEGFGTFGTFFFLQTMLPKIVLGKQTKNDQYAMALPQNNQSALTNRTALKLENDKD